MPSIQGHQVGVCLHVRSATNGRGLNLVQLDTSAIVYS